MRDEEIDFVEIIVGVIRRCVREKGYEVFLVARVKSCPQGKFYREERGLGGELATLSRRQGEAICVGNWLNVSLIVRLMTVTIYCEQGENDKSEWRIHLMFLLIINDKTHLMAW